MNYLLRLTQEEHKQLKTLAAEKGVSMKDLILKSTSGNEYTCSDCWYTDYDTGNECRGADKSCHEFRLDAR